MFKEIVCEQGTEAWFTARLGKITASVADKIITGTGKLSASSEEIINKAVAELILGEREETFQNDAMKRGNELEGEALAFFNMVYGYNFEPCGFFESVDGGFGCSVDGIDREKKISLELKCPLSHTHVSYLAGGVLPKKYFQQVQFQLMVTGFDKVIFGSYHPKIKGLHVVVNRDEKFISEMRKHVSHCVNLVQERYNLINKDSQ